MKRRIVTEWRNVADVLRRVTEEQQRRNVFARVTVEQHHGRGRGDLAVVRIG